MRYLRIDDSEKIAACESVAREFSVRYNRSSARLSACESRPVLVRVAAVFFQLR